MLNTELLQRIGINYKKGLTYFGQDEDMYNRYLTDFAHETYVENAIHKIQANDVNGAFSYVHSYKSLVEYVSIPSIDEIVHEITETLRAGKTEGVMDGLIFIRTATEEIKAALLKEL